MPLPLFNDSSKKHSQSAFLLLYFEKPSSFLVRAGSHRDICSAHTSSPYPYRGCNRGRARLAKKRGRSDLATLFRTADTMHCAVTYNSRHLPAATCHSCKDC